MISFDREAPGGGVDAYTVMENSKAEIIFTVYLKQLIQAEPKMQAEENVQVELFLYAPDGQETARMSIKTTPEHVAKATENCWSVSTRTLLIYPHLWQGTLTPVLYQVEAMITSLSYLYHAAGGKCGFSVE